MARRRNKDEERDLAVRRIAQLAGRARREAAARRPELADRYGRLALGLAQKHQTGFPRAAKAAWCRKCGAHQGAAAVRVRVRAGRVVRTCLRCGAVARRPLVARHAPAGAGAA